MASDFEWTDEVEAVPAQMRTAVYFNEAGNVVIRQDPGDGDDDDVIIIGRKNLQTFIDSLHRLATRAAEEDDKIEQGKT